MFHPFWTTCAASALIALSGLTLPAQAPAPALARPPAPPTGRADADYARGAYDAILPDLRWTGLRTGLSILELAAASGIEVSLHNPVGPILDLVSVQVAAALPSFLILERQVRESPLFEELRGPS